MENLTNRTVTITRTFKAPIDLVWEAWTQADHIIKWWAPPGMDFKIIEHNFTEGGHWKYTMLMPNGSEFISEGTYKEIVPKEKIVTSADFKPMTEGVEMHMLFQTKGEETEFTFLVVHPTEAYKLAQEKMGIYNGWGSAFNRLENFLHGGRQ
jgi:uncharacterized protein YndB with AHSA1/START domain